LSEAGRITSRLNMEPKVKSCASKVLITAAKTATKPKAPKVGGKTSPEIMAKIWSDSRPTNPGNKSRPSKPSNTAGSQRATKAQG
jgi:hypothetical protein